MAESFKIIQRELRALSDIQRAQALQRYFKTAPGQYGENDIFIGLTVPQVRVLARKYRDLSVPVILKFLKSKIHEERLFALMILTGQFEKGDESDRRKIYNLYLKNKQFVNNWDLVDGSAPTIVGGALFQRDRKRLYQLARSRSLWDRRIAILATAYFIRENDFHETYALAELLLKDREDLIHKAVGWMLREAGKKNLKQLRQFLLQHAHQMPRTMLRYAIEKMGSKERQRFMRLKSAS